MIHLFASDYDGTLFHGGPISDEDLKAIEKFRALGHKFGIITGRSINSIIDEVNEKKIPFDFLSGVNGGVVLDHRLNEIKVYKMDDSIVMDVLKFIDHFGVNNYGVNDGYDHINVKYHDIINKVHSESFERVYANGITGMYIACHSSAEALKLAEVINEAFKDHEIRCYTNEIYVDIASIYNSKSTGVLDILNHYELDGDAYTIGDSYNDVPMIRDYNGFLMSNGVPTLESYAKLGIVNSVSEALEIVMKEVEKKDS